jgi:hypothetical protein
MGTTGSSSGSMSDGNSSSSNGSMNSDGSQRRARRDRN